MDARCLRTSDMARLLDPPKSAADDVFLLACKTGDLHVMKQTIRYGGGQWFHGAWFAALNGHKRSVQYLWDHRHQWEPFVHGSVIGNNIHILTWMTDNGFEDIGLVFELGCQHGHMDVIQWALDNDISERCSVSAKRRGFMHACHYNQLEAAQWAVAMLRGDDDDGDARLAACLNAGMVRACRNGCFRVLQWLAGLTDDDGVAGCITDECKQSSLEAACYSGELGVVQWLMRRMNWSERDWDAACREACAGGHPLTLAWLTTMRRKRQWR